MPEYFFVVGAQRSGTTYLTHLLDEHPEIEMAKPFRPEPKYFLQKEIDFTQYATRYFGDNTKLRGEKSTSYYESEKVAKSMAYHFPDAKIIFILRDPIVRAASNYYLTQSYGHDYRSLEDALASGEDRCSNYDKEKFSVCPFAYISRGEYSRFINIYLKHFSKNQIIILIFEDFVGRILAIQQLYRQLGVEESFVPPSLDTYINGGEDFNKLSSSFLIECIAPTLLDSLREHFKPFKQELEVILEKEITCWL